MAFQMDRASSERWVVISAAIVAGIYAYRRTLGPASSSTQGSGVTLKRVAGLGDPVPLGAFAAAWGFVFLTVSVMAAAAPGLGGSFAILIATGDVLTNASDFFGLVTVQETGALQQSQATAKTGAAQVKAGQRNRNATKGGVQIVAGTATQGVGNVGAGATSFGGGG